MKRRELEIAIEEKRPIMSRRSSGHATFKNPILEDTLITEEAEPINEKPKKAKSPWVFNPS